jgi:chemotaxis protein histidine kinase CheA
MRVAAMRLGRNAVCMVAFGGLVLVSGAARADESAADAIAEKFSRAAEDSERREAESKKAEAERASVAARKVEVRRKAEAERKAAEQRKADETDMLEQAKAEVAAHQAEGQRQAEATRLAKEAEEKRLIEERQSEEARKADAAHAELEASRSEAAQCIADKFRFAQESRILKAQAKNAAPAANSSVAEQAATPMDRKPDTNQASFLPTRITVLLVIQPRNGGHFTHTANPILCIENGCYISGGLQSAADYMSRSKALGPLNSIGRRAGLCQNQLRCAFRDVDLGGTVGFIQPVDMGLLHHDRREVRKAEPDQTCDVAHGRLYCSAPIIAHDYRAWVVPEFVAAKAGAAALEKALEEGLPASRSAWLDAQ